MNLSTLRHAAGLLALTATLACTALPAQAVVLDGHIVLVTAGGSTSYGVKPNLKLTIDQTPEGNYTGATFLHQWGLLKLVALNTDEGSSWYLVKKGDLINANTSASTGAKVIPNVDQTGNTLGGAKAGNDFYLAGLTRTSYTSPATVFGWVHLKKDIWGRFKLVDAAVAYDETGIVVGTRLTALPTP